MREIDFINREYDVFRMFNDQWALATAGNEGDYNTLTIGWGSLGSLWGPPKNGRHTVTIYVSPARYSFAYLEKNDYFTVSFFPEAYRKDLGYLGSHSGRDGDKVANTSLTPFFLPEGVTFKEAELTFVCKKIYSDAFDGSRAPEDIRDRVYTRIPAHHFYIGEIVRVLVPDELK